MIKTHKPGKSTAIHIRLKNTDIEMLKRVADEERLPLTATIRSLIFKGLKVRGNNRLKDNEIVW